MKIVREKLPKALMRDFFAVRLPDVIEKEEQEEGVEVELDELSLEETEQEETEVIIAMASKGCHTLKKGDSVLMSAQMGERGIVGGFKTIDGQYLVYRESDIIGVW